MHYMYVIVLYRCYSTPFLLYTIFSLHHFYYLHMYTLSHTHTHTHVQPTTAHEPPKPQYKFVDLPYTEWISQRWIYDADAPFSNWPSLPPTVKTVQQVTSGALSYRNGVWLLTDSELVFVDNLKSHKPGNVNFYNVTEELDIEIQMGNRVIMMNNGKLFLVTEETIFLLDCSQFNDENPYVSLSVCLTTVCTCTYVKV